MEPAPDDDADDRAFIGFETAGEQKRRLESVSKKRGWNKSLICREALQEWLDKYEDADKGLLGLVGGDPQ